MNKPAELLKRAEQLAKELPVWADLFNALYDPIEGILAVAYPTRAEREAFIKTPEYRQITDLIAKAREGDKLLSGANPTRVTASMRHIMSPSLPVETSPPALPEEPKTPDQFTVPS
jgi:hypothetical protein